MYFNQYKSMSSETDNSQNGNKASISRPTPNVVQITERAYVDKLIVTEGSKKQKGEFAKQYHKK